MSVTWPQKFLGLARHIASWGKAEGTNVGAVARDTDSNAVLETGYSGLPRGVHDLPERMNVRPDKYLWTGHAEENLVAHAARRFLEGSTVSVTHFCCCRCARMLINSGVKRIEYGDGTTSMPPEEFEIARVMFREAGVEFVAVTAE